MPDVSLLHFYTNWWITMIYYNELPISSFNCIDFVHFMFSFIGLIIFPLSYIKQVFYITLQLQKHLSAKDHPYHKFSTGMQFYLIPDLYHNWSPLNCFKWNFIDQCLIFLSVLNNINTILAQWTQPFLFWNACLWYWIFGMFVDWFSFLNAAIMCKLNTRLLFLYVRCLVFVLIVFESVNLGLGILFYFLAFMNWAFMWNLLGDFLQHFPKCCVFIWIMDSFTILLNTWTII